MKSVRQICFLGLIGIASFSFLLPLHAEPQINTFGPHLFSEEGILEMTNVLQSLDGRWPVITADSSIKDYEVDLKSAAIPVTDMGEGQPQQRAKVLTCVKIIVPPQMDGKALYIYGSYVGATSAVAVNGNFIDTAFMRICGEDGREQSFTDNSDGGIVGDARVVGKSISSSHCVYVYYVGYDKMIAPLVLSKVPFRVVISDSQPEFTDEWLKQSKGNWNKALKVLSNILKKPIREDWPYDPAGWG